MKNKHVKNFESFKIENISKKNSINEQLLTGISNSEKQKSKEMYEDDESLLVYAEALYNWLVDNEPNFLKEIDIFDDLQISDILLPQTHDHYGLVRFITYVDGEEREYAIGNDDMVDTAATTALENLIDDLGVIGLFNQSFWIDRIDGQAVYDMFGEDDYDVREYPENYGIEKTMIPDSKTRLEELEKVLETEEDDDRIEEIQEEIDEINDESSDEHWEYSEDAIDEYLESRKQDIIDDPLDHLWNLGIVSRDKEGRYSLEETRDRNFEHRIFDIDQIIEDSISEDGRGHNLSSYDGIENEVEHDGTTYYIYRTN